MKNFPHTFVIHTAVAHYLASPSTETATALCETWNARAKKLSTDELQQIIDELQSDKSKVEIPAHLLADIERYDGYDRVICSAGDSAIVCAPDMLGGKRSVAIYTRDELQSSYEMHAEIARLRAERLSLADS